MSQPPVVAPAVRKLAIVEKPVEVARFRVMVGSELFKVTPPLNVPVVNAPVLAVVAPIVPPSYSNVEDALGSVKVFSLDAGPLNFAKPFPVPP